MSIKDTEKHLQNYMIHDPEAFSRNLSKAMEEAGKAAAASLGSPEAGQEAAKTMSGEVSEVVKTFSKVGEYWLSEPQRAMEAQAKLFSQYMQLWQSSLKHTQGQESPPTAEPAQGDKRFADEDWQKNQFFDFLKQYYLIVSKWAEDMVDQAEDLDPQTKRKAQFYIKQMVNASSPSNFLLTNPQLLKETMQSNGENLVRGMKMLAEDIAAGKGELKLRQTDSEKFKVGENLAITPGKVIYQNELCQLIQYAPITEKVLKRPLLIVPPWINKFYILDLNPEKSFIRWAVERGHSVFVISWVNPDAQHAQKSFEHYMKEGIFESLAQIEKATGEKQVNAIGYCVGGTLLAAALAYMAQTKDKRIASATFFTTQVDFTHAGDLQVFIDEQQVAMLEKQMEKLGYLEGSKMAATFNMLRSEDLIWPYFINNYLRGQEPSAFDLLYWNSDSTRMPAANHSFYLRNCYLENNLAKGKMVISGKELDLSKIKIPVYNLATREDHIAPAQSVFKGSSLFGGPVEFMLAGSGHIAGVINPPHKNKYHYWTGGAPTGGLEEWIKNAKQHPGSWWPHWQTWIEDKNNTRVRARTPGDNGIKCLEDAPGSYVTVKS